MLNQEIDIHTTLDDSNVFRSYQTHHNITIVIELCVKRIFNGRFAQMASTVHSKTGA